MQINHSTVTTPADIFTPAARQKLGADFTKTPQFRMGRALQSTLGHIFGGIDLHLEPEHRRARKDARRAAGKRQRTARKLHRGA